MADGTPSITLRTVGAMADIDKAVWDRLANPEGQPFYPFAAHDFLDALETSSSVRAEVGWAPQHLILEDGSDVLGVMPLYLKSHSQGEYIFDHAWADAYERAGGRYYPKLLSAIPFTPAEGPRLLAADPVARAALAAESPRVAQHLGITSLHVNFTGAEDLDVFKQTGQYLHRTGQQYRFTDDGFGDWDGFLSALASRKRKALRKERGSIRDQGLAIDWITGRDITEAHLDQFWVFYQDTGSRKWGTPYLTRTFFSLLVERMADRVLLVMARRGDRYIAGALNLIGGDTLFGRYWGCTEPVPFLHFEVCYYQAIDYALAHGLTTVDAGAQGEHKIARGYRPVTTHSVHFFADPGFRRAVDQYLEAERREVEDANAYLDDFTPFRKAP